MANLFFKNKLGFNQSFVQQICWRVWFKIVATDKQKNQDLGGDICKKSWNKLKSNVSLEIMLSVWQTYTQRSVTLLGQI